MFNLKSEIYLKIIFLLSFTALIGAYFIEYVLGHQPCNLCLIERIPYGLSIILISIILILKKNEKFFIILLILTFVFSFTISLYHLGIEQGIFEESTVCTAKDFSENITKEDLLNQLSKRIINCKDVTFRIFGLSLTTFNIVISLFLSILLINMFRNYDKFKKQS